jgi:hypothetical protein
LWGEEGSKEKAEVRKMSNGENCIACHKKMGNSSSTLTKEDATNGKWPKNIIRSFNCIGKPCHEKCKEPENTGMIEQNDVVFDILGSMIKLRTGHYPSCPQYYRGMDHILDVKMKCNCGTDYHNELIDKIISELKRRGMI